ncbi:MAG TPA: tetratricopeptide repeat protein, partial [Oculatellaceae cyanobacterium]
SKNPQLLWFEVNRHTDFEEIIQFLIQSIPELCDQERNTPFSPDRRMDRSRPGTPSSGEDPLKRLESGLSSVQDMPLLLVLDNVEYIVDANLRLNSPPFKELLNLLLARPNIKMVLSGERLPYADMSPGQESVLSLQLEGLGEQETLACWLKKTSDPGTNIHDPAILESAFPNETESLKALWQKIKGTPWLIKVVDAWHRHTKMDFVTLHRQLKDAENPQEALIRWIEDTLPEGHQRVIQTLAFLRHPVSARALPALTSACFPLQGALPNEATVLEILEHPLIRVLLKISFPPQQVLNHIRNRNAQGSGKYPPWFELYFAAKQTLCRSLPDAEQARIHDALQDFYLKDKAHEAEQRILRIKNRAMLAEAKYHGGLTRQRPELSSKAGPPTSFNSLAYVYRQGSAPRHAPRTTLDDYRNIQIPEEAFLPELADLTEPIDAEPVTSSTSASFTDILANLEEDAESQERAFIQEAREAYLQERLRKETTTHPQSPENISEKADQDLQAVTGHLLTENHAEDEERHIQKKLAAAVAARDADRLARSLLELAQYRLNRGRHEEALQCLDKLAQLKPTSALSAEMHQLYGAVYKASYRHNAAISAISKAIEAFEQQGSKSAQLGKAYQALGEIQAYRKQYADAAKSY